MNLEQKQKYFKLLSKFIAIVLVSIIFTRIWATSIYYIWGHNSQFIDLIENDPWHHYHVGLLILIFSLVFRKLKHAATLIAIGLGILLEEWPVVLSDLGFNTLHYYHSTKDILVVLFLVISIGYISKFCYSRYGTMKIIKQ